MSEPAGDPASRHYSYAHYADKDVAEGFDALRFGGPIGRYLLEEQQRLLLTSLSPVASRRILDVGAGTGRASLALAEAGAVVTGVDASREMLDVAAARAKDAHLAIQFDVADAHHLPFADRAFDATVCFRLLMHVPDWTQCVRELCRVSARRVVLDFPARLSFAAIESAARRRAAAAGRKTEPYRVIAEADMRAALTAGGFRIVDVSRQFVLPIALHKRVNALGATKTLESVLAGVGLRRLLGSPVTMVAER